MATLVERYVQSAIQTHELLQEIMTQPIAKRGISQERLDMVVQYLRKHPGSTQSEIADATGLNSGSVSTAIRQLSTQHRVEAEGDGERGLQNFLVNAR